MADRRIMGVDRGPPFEIRVNNSPLRAYPGETIAGVLLASGINIFRRTLENGTERGQFCGMGICYDCLVEVDGRPLSRACMTAAAPGLEITLPPMAHELEP